MQTHHLMIIDAMASKPAQPEQGELQEIENKTGKEEYLSKPFFLLEHGQGG